jgi:HAD superfamily hydrolase (TIGR01662 family)
MNVELFSDIVILCLVFQTSDGRLITSILFDLGGTLIHLDKPTADVVKARLKALHNMFLSGGLDIGYSELSEIYHAVHSELSLFSEETGIETTTSRILEEVFARLGILGLRHWVMEDLVRDFFEPEIKSWVVYDDTLSILSSLKSQGYRLGIVSNARSHWAVIEIMRRLGIDWFFNTTVTSAKFGLRKPRPEIYLKAMRDLGSNIGSTVMIGNSLDTDVIGAKRLKTKALYLEREIPDQRPVEPDATLKSLSDILEVINKWKEL